MTQITLSGKDGHVYKVDAEDVVIVTAQVPFYERVTFTGGISPNDKCIPPYVDGVTRDTKNFKEFRFINFILKKNPNASQTSLTNSSDVLMSGAYTLLGQTQDFSTNTTQSNWWEDPSLEHVRIADTSLVEGFIELYKPIIKNKGVKCLAFDKG